MSKVTYLHTMLFDIKETHSLHVVEKTQTSMYNIYLHRYIIIATSLQLFL